MDCRPENPLLTLPTDQNLIAVEVDALPVTALIDTGAHISVMSADLRKRLKKVLTPAESRFVRVADGELPLCLECVLLVSASPVATHLYCFMYLTIVLTT